MSRKTKQITCNIIAGIVILPALVLLANLVVFAFAGYGFLPDPSENMSDARIVITGLCIALGPIIAALGEVL